MVEKKVTVLNKAGLHARPSSMIVKTASHYDVEIFIGTEGYMVNAKSIMGVMTLGAGIGSELTIRVEGDEEEEEEEAIETIVQLFTNKFSDG